MTVRTGYFCVCCWILKSCCARTINTGISESVALASVPEMEGEHSASLSHKPPNSQGIREGRGASVGT